MAPIEPLENGTKWSKIIKHFVALLYAMAPLAYIAYAVYYDIQIDMIWWVLMITGWLASAYVIFGKKQVDAALEEAKELTDAGDGGSE